MTVAERDAVPPPVTVRKVPVCVCCKGTSGLIQGDGPVVCHQCIIEAGVMAQATVRRNDSPDPRRLGWWR